MITVVRLRGSFHCYVCDTRVIVAIAIRKEALAPLIVCETCCGEIADKATTILENPK